MSGEEKLALGDAVSTTRLWAFRLIGPLVVIAVVLVNSGLTVSPPLSDIAASLLLGVSLGSILATWAAFTYLPAGVTIDYEEHGKVANVFTSGVMGPTLLLMLTVALGIPIAIVVAILSPVTGIGLESDLFGTFTVLLSAIIATALIPEFAWGRDDITAKRVPSTQGDSTIDDQQTPPQDTAAQVREHLEADRIEQARHALGGLKTDTDADTVELDTSSQYLGLRVRVLKATARDASKRARDALQDDDYETAATELNDLKSIVRDLEALNSEAAEAYHSTATDLESKVETAQARTQADSRVIGLLGSIGAAKSRTNDLVEAGKYTQALDHLDSTLDSCDEAAALNETHDLGRGDRIAEFESDLRELKQRAESNIGRNGDIQEQYAAASRALKEGELKAAQEEIVALKNLIAKSAVSSPLAGVDGSLEVLESRLQEQVEAELAALRDAAETSESEASIRLDEGKFEAARDWATEGVEHCRDYRALAAYVEYEPEAIDSLRDDLESLRERAAEIADVVATAEDEVSAVERALQSRAYDTAEERLPALRGTITDLEAYPETDEVVSTLEERAETLEQDIAAGRASSRVSGLLGSAMSNRSQAADLLTDGDYEAAVSRLESAEASIEKAATLNQRHTLEQDASIAEKRDAITDLLEEATKRPYEDFRERLTTAEAAIEDGITHRDRDDPQAAVKSFAEAYEAYESALDLTDEYGFDERWEVEQRYSMVAEYLEVAQDERDDRQHAVRTSLEHVLDDAEPALERAEQHAEVGDTVSARESLADGRSALDKAAQLVETGFATETLEDRYDSLSARADTLDETLPETEDSKYRTQDLIEALQVLTTKLGESPRPEFVNKYGEYPADAYLEAFGSWSEALAVANLDPIDEDARERRTYSRVETLDAIRDLTEELGHQPSRTEMNRAGAMSSTTVANRFADWETALTLSSKTIEQTDQPSEQSGLDKYQDSGRNDLEQTTAETGENDQGESGDVDDILGQIETEIDEL